ncbi:MAG: sulfur carrier protein ThiS [Bermanella sp.]
MKIVFNGKAVELHNTCTLSDVLSDNKITQDVPVEQAVVAVNQVLVHKNDYKTLVMKEGDQIEMLTAVVGG